MAKPQPSRRQAAAAPPPELDPELDPANVDDTDPEDTTGTPADVPELGSVVAFSYGDETNPTVRFGIVLGSTDTHPDGSDRLDDNGDASPGVVVGWFASVSDPIDAHLLETASR